MINYQWHVFKLDFGVCDDIAADSKPEKTVAQASFPKQLQYFMLCLDGLECDECIFDQVDFGFEKFRIFSKEFYQFFTVFTKLGGKHLYFLLAYVV